ncbi:GNAT family N-acetyltransferase [Marinobacterium arenosum]|uniref:GNAT family N-acetyltransferase n=1 Tax=Marinobacterium arenosum TaxID=2862496 RepID=UPI001C96D517|nr:GNAT family N-acetyltransferase [Marinobacterium arenosum]MBY4675338.1 GNAT family N-acetyltransferase [Marinobacterium arenosum]
MQDKNYSIRVMSRDEVDIAVEWAATEGWNPGLKDADCYMAADPNGFLVGCLGDEPIATISVIKYDEYFGFLGFYIVKPEYRGQGYGIQIWNAGLRYLEGQNIGLDGIVAQQDNYKKSGFRLAYRNIRYEGVGGGVSPEDMGIVKLSILPFETVDAYDQPFFPATRSSFTRCWINQPECHSLGIMEHGKLAGYGVIRKCRNGYKIGPLFADNPKLAESLFRALKAKATSSDAIFLDTPEVNTAAVSLAEKYEMRCSFETARMYTGAFPDIPLDRVFGVTSFEVG